MIDCADSTRLRTHLDEPVEGLDAHLDGCEDCSGLLRSVAADAGYVRQALSLLDPDPDGAAPTEVDTESALASTLADLRMAEVAASTGPLRPRRSRRWTAVRRVVLAAAVITVVVAVATPGGRSALAGVLDVLRGERLQPVTVDVDDWAASFGPDDVRAIVGIGDVDTSVLGDPLVVDGVAAAESLAGIAAPNLPGRPDRVVALAPGTVRLVLAGEDEGVPADLAGATLVIEVPGAIGALYRMEGGDGPPPLVIGRSGRVQVHAEGTSLEVIRDHLLAREELPADLRAQLAAIDDWRSTLPVPVPVDGPGWRETEVAGRPAVAFGDDSGLGAFVLRQDPDGVTLVGGVVGITQALELAATA